MKKKDPCIYNQNVKFFDNIDKPGTTEDAVTEEKPKKKLNKDKALFLRDYERKIVIERNGQFSSSEDEDDVTKKTATKTLTYVAEQQELKDSFKHALKDDDEAEDVDLLTIKKKTEDEKQKVTIYFNDYSCLFIFN